MPHSKGSKRINEKTSLPFKVGCIRDDGYVFDGYQPSIVRKNTGFFKEKWRSPESWKSNLIYRKKRRIKLYHQISKYVNDYKLSKGCKKCGYKISPYALQFHHIDASTKTNNVSYWFRTSWKQFDKMKNEIKKCIVLCANCHLVETKRILDEN